MLNQKINFIVILCATSLFSCGGSSDNSAAANTASRDQIFYRPLTSADVDTVKKTWAERDLSAKDIALVYEHTEGTANVKIYEHKVGANKHYGAIITPTTPKKSQLPVELWLDGLDQSNPSITIEENLKNNFTGDTILVIPAYRGRTMYYDGKSFFAGGDFCDAWDGATDDTIALLNVVEATTPLADMNKILAAGYSRGGNIALLIAERDKRITTVIDGAGPVDFYRADVRAHYGQQYLCQFISNFTEDQSRQRMLASSPLYFNFLPNVKNVYIFNGANDTTVPLWNAQEMNNHLLAQGLIVKYYIYDGYDHGTIWGSQNFFNTWIQAHTDFANSND